MKRILIRVAALSSVVVVGLIAIAYAQRGSGTSDETQADAAPGAAAGASAAPGAAKPQAASGVTDPFARLNEANPPPAAGSGRKDLFNRVNHETSAQPAATQAANQGLVQAPEAQPPVASDTGGPPNFAANPLPKERHRAAETPPPAGDRYGNLQQPEPAAAAESESPNPLRGNPPARFLDPAPFDAKTQSGVASGSDATPQQRFASDASEPGRLGADSGNPLRQVPVGRNSGLPMAQPGKPEVYPAGNPEVYPPGKPAAHTTASLTDGSGRPGNKLLEGAQTPTLTIQKFAPAEIQIGKAATFEILVRNVGEAAAQSVTIHDQVPKGTRLASTNPPADRSANGELVWALGTMEPGQEQVVKIELLPLEEGEIGSVATVQFAAQSSVRTLATRPVIELEVTSEKSVLIGGEIALLIKISNPGTGPATGVMIKNTLPATLSHPSGSELEYEVGELKPGESRELELVLTAAKAGLGTNVLSARGDGNLKIEKPTDIEVVAPALEVSLEGPRRRFLERPATYTVSVANPGTAAAREVELITYLPKGMEFVKADHFGEYDPQTRAIRWSLESLPAKESGRVSLTAMPIEAGEQKLAIEATAQQGISDKKIHDVLVEGVAAIVFQVVDVEDPIEAGSETIYEVHVVNQGSKAATDVQIEAVLPEGMKALSAEGPARFSINGGQVLFEPLPRLAPKADVTFRIRVQCLQAGDLRTRVRLMTKEMTSPVTKEESTRVFPAE